MSVSNYQDLKVWQISLLITEQVYQITRNFPKQETYGLSSQIQRASVSIPSNIAEGNARESTKEYLHHLSIAFGSLAELETQLILAQRLGYLTSQEAELIFPKLDELGKMLRGLQKSLKARLVG